MSWIWRGVGSTFGRPIERARWIGSSWRAWSRRWCEFADEDSDVQKSTRTSPGSTAKLFGLLVTGAEDNLLLRT